MAGDLPICRLHFPKGAKVPIRLRLPRRINSLSVYVIAYRNWSCEYGRRVLAGDIRVVAIVSFSGFPGSRSTKRVCPKTRSSLRKRGGKSESRLKTTTTKIENSESKLEFQVELSAPWRIGGDGLSEERRSDHANVSYVVGMIEHVERIQ